MSTTTWVVLPMAVRRRRLVSSLVEEVALWE